MILNNLIKFITVPIGAIGTIVKDTKGHPIVGIVAIVAIVAIAAIVSMLIYQMSLKPSNAPLLSLNTIQGETLEEPSIFHNSPICDDINMGARYWDDNETTSFACYFLYQD